MKRIVLGTIAAAALSFSAIPGASAADLPVKAVPMIVPAVAWNWSGVYVGVSGGWARQNFDWAFNPPIPAAANQAFSLGRSSGIFDVHAGIQRQFGQWLIGVEFAYNWLGDDFARHTGYGVDAASFAAARVTQLWTVGPRLGWIPTGMSNAMLYVTGGFASGRVETALITIATGVAVPAFNTSQTQNGWFVGVGGEYMVTQYLIFGVEYQHIDLQNVCHNAPVGGTACGTANTNNHNVDPQIDKVTARLSFKFNPFP